MTIYIIIFSLILICSYIYDRHDSKTRHWCFIVIIIILSLVGGGRYRIGVDTIRYIRAFDNMPSLAEFSQLEWSDLSQPLWLLLNIILKSIYDDFVIVQLVHSFLVNFLIGRFIYKTCKRPILALLFYYCICWWNFNFEIMRESLCVAIYLNLYYNYIRNNNIWKFVCGSFPLLFIHWFAFVPVLLTLLINFVSTKILFIGGTCFSVVMFCYLNESSSIQILFNLIGVLSDASIYRVGQYLVNDSSGYVNVSILGILIIFLTNIAYPLCVAKSQCVDNRIKKILFLYAFIVFIRIKLIIVSRFLNYWDIILIVYSINVIIEQHRGRIANLYLKSVLIYSLYIGVLNFYKPSPLEDRDNISYDCRYIPYSSYLDKTKDKNREYLWSIVE